MTKYFLALLIGLVGCTAGQKQVVRTALDVASYACIIANAGSADETIAKVCAIEAELVPALKELLRNHRMAMSKAGACPPAPAPSSSAPKGDAGK